MTERQVNTLMAGARGARSTRGKYSAAGYNGEDSRQLYIARVPAGSAQDALRDLNRPGYRSERPWNETPAFEEGGAAAAPVQRRAKRKKPMTLGQWLAYHAKRERKDVAACAALLCVILTMAAMWGQNLISGTQIQNAITKYQSDTNQLNRENELLEQRLTMARSGERIRNLAQNELNMLRKERAHTETIYIQAPEKAKESLQHNDEPRMELLDVLLGLLNVLNIGE